MALLFLLFLLLFFFVWALFSLPYAIKIPIWLKWKNPRRASWVLAILFLSMPFMDEIIGKIYFAYQCKSKTELLISPNIQSYNSLKITYKSKNLSSIPIRIYINETSYDDIASGENAIKEISLSTGGGWLRRESNISKSDTCQEKHSDGLAARCGFTYEKDGVFLRK